MVCEGEYGCSNVCHSYCLNIEPIPEHWVCQDCEAQESESLADEESSSEEESSEINSEIDSDPDAEYQPDVESPVARRRSERRKNAKPKRIQYRSSSEESECPDYESEASEQEIRYISSEDERFVENTHSSGRRLKSLKRLKRNSRPSVINISDSSNHQHENQDNLMLIALPAKRLRSNTVSNSSSFKKFVNDFVGVEIAKELENFPGERVNANRIQRVLSSMITKNQRLSNYQDPRNVQKMKTMIKNYIAGLI